jgi:hypothetical protein
MPKVSTFHMKEVQDAGFSEKFDTGAIVFAGGTSTREQHHHKSATIGMRRSRNSSHNLLQLSSFF